MAAKYSQAIASRLGYNYGMKFSWDEAKRKNNLQKHGIDFIDNEEIRIISFRKATKRETEVLFQNI